MALEAPEDETEDEMFSTHLVNVCIVIDAVTAIVVFRLTIILIQYLWLKCYHPTKFTAKYKITRPSLRLVYYLQWSNLFIILCKIFFLFYQIQSVTLWLDYCDKYTISEYQVTSECSSDEYCLVAHGWDSKDTSIRKKTTSCNPPAGIIAIYVLSWTTASLMIMYLCVSQLCCADGMKNDEAKINWVQACSDSLMILRYSQWKDKYYKKQLFVFNLNSYTLIRYGISIFCFYAIIIAWLPFYFNIPFIISDFNVAFVIALVLVSVLYVMNEFIKYAFYWNVYDEEKCVLYLLEILLGIEIAKIIWFDYMAMDINTNYNTPFEITDTPKYDARKEREFFVKFAQKYNQND
eukprot:149892_1